MVAKKQNPLIILIRLALSLFLVYMVFIETGIWTAITIGLLFVGLEGLSLSLKLKDKKFRHNGVFYG